MRIYPSILAADFSCLSPPLRDLEQAGIPNIHLDVMDGHFVPNITFGTPVVRSLTGAFPELRFDAHLMISRPEKYFDTFLEMGLESISVHVEVDPQLEQLREKAHDAGTKFGLCFNPETPVEPHRQKLAGLDFVMTMTVEPGFGGQSFREEVLPKIEQLHAMYDGPIQVDGGVNPDTIQKASRAGAEWFIAGSSVFGTEDPVEAAKTLQQRAEDAVREPSS